MQESIHQQRLSWGREFTDLIIIPVLELKIDLAGTAIAEWVLPKIILATDYSRWN